jgi:hypothetical protein
MSKGVAVVIVAMIVAVFAVVLVFMLQKKHPKLIITGFAFAFSAACIAFMLSYDSPEELKKEAVILVFRSLFGFDYKGYGEVIKMDVFQIGHLIPMSIAIFFLGAYLLWRYLLHRNDYSEEKHAFERYLIIFNIIGYALIQVFRLTGAVTSMAYKNQANLAIADNYIAGYFLAFIMFICYLFLKEYVDKGDFSGKTALIILVFLLSFFNCSTVLVNLLDKPREHYFYALDGFEFEFGDKVYLMDVNIEAENLNGDFYYQAAPAKSAGGTWYLDYMGEKLTPKQVSEELIECGYNYLYVENIGPDFKEYYGELFSNPEDFDFNHLYSVGVVGDKVVLEKVR